MPPVDLKARLEKLERYDLVEYGGYYRDHHMDKADDGEWMRVEDVLALLIGEEPPATMRAIETCTCGAARPESARYGHSHLPWCDRYQAPVGEEPPADPWQPIETCPRDREVFFWLVPKTADESFADTSGKPIVSNHAPYWKRGLWQSWGALSKPTHWMPMLRPPLAASPRVGAEPSPEKAK